MQKLTKAEEKIMQYIWDLGRCTVSDILSKMSEPIPPHSSVSTTVRILEKKGFVGFKSYGKTHEYFPIIQKEEYSSSSLDNFIENYFGGKASSLVSFLVNEKKIDTKELEDLLNKD